MNPNDLLLSHLAAGSDDDTIVRAMSSAVFGLTGEVGPQGFGATTLDGHLVLFTQPEFYAVAGLPPGLEAVEATAKQSAEYARAVGLFGFVLNPGTHQRFVAGGAIERLEAPLRPPEPPVAPKLFAWAEPSEALVEKVRVAAKASSVEAVWLATGPAVVTRPHPDPAFEAGLLSRDVRVPSYAATPDWTPIFEREAPATAKIRLFPLSRPLPPAFAKDLVDHARIHRLAELWAFEARIGEEDTTLAFAFSPHPHDAFSADFDLLHTRHSVGAESPLLDAATLREALPRMGTRIA